MSLRGSLETEPICLLTNVLSRLRRPDWPFPTPPTPRRAIWPFFLQQRIGHALNTESIHLNTESIFPRSVRELTAALSG
jgi:hypothetical protein